MPDFKVTFRGDLGNLSQFDAAVRNSAVSSARALAQANQKIASSVGRITGAYGADKSGLFVRKQQGIADAINNTFKQSGDVVRRYVSGYKVEVDKLGKHTVSPLFSSAYESSFKKAIGNLAAYNEALIRVAPHEREFLRVSQSLSNKQASIGNRRNDIAPQLDQARALAGGRVLNSPIQQQRIQEAAIRNDIAKNEAVLAGMAPNQKGRGQVRKTISDLKADLAQVRGVIATEKVKLRAEINGYNRELDKLRASESSAISNAGRRQKNILRRGAVQDLRAAAAATPPIQADLGRALSESKDLQKNLLRSGLGLGTKYGTPEFQRALAQQEAQVTSYTRNLRTNVRTIQGQFNDASGLSSKFTVDLDKQGKVIGRWGGQLGGAGSILRQTVRDFQKVIEWTVATSLVFGSLAAVIGQLKSINELNTSLARFSITAQTSAQGTAEFFKELTQVSIATATPLKELVKVADDIALATRQAGDSSEQWKQKILDLTNVVGIFTNLTGKDTVAAADQLSAAFKQLDIEPNQLIGILNKVTAVSGGQANAIADIVQSVSGLAEAAKAAGFSVDEQIAGIQVLSQVTNKTSAEIATSFKNLFGSVTSVGSKKILEEFGIEVRDASGGVRDFLDIYRDVADALAKGIIPQNRLPDVLRGISGGPRRAPDAAALLSNIGRIDEVVIKSQNATNEALIANAKILDTNQAKIVQFQNAIDSAVFQKFGQAIKELTDILLTFGLAFASIIGGLDSTVVATTIKLAALTLGVLAFGKVIAIIGRGLGIGAALSGLKSLASGFKAVALEADKATLAADVRIAERLGKYVGAPGTVFASAPVQTSRFSKLGEILKNNKKAAAIGAVGAVGAAGALAGGIDSNTVGTTLQLAGSLALLSGALAPIGIAAIVAGTAIQLLSGNSEKAKDNTASLSSEIYTLTQNIQASQDTVNSFTKQQQEAGNVIERLKDKTKKTAEEQSQLAEATTSYVQATLGLANANREVANSFDEILQKIPDLAAKYQSFKDLVQTGGLSPNDPFLKDLQNKLASDILKNSGQAVYAGATIPTADSFRAAKTGGGTQVVINSSGKVFDLKDLITNPSELKTIFGLNFDKTDVFYGSETYGGVPRNETSLKLVQSALSQLIADPNNGGLSAEELKLLVDAVTKLSDSASSLSQNTAAFAQLNAITQARVLTGELKGPEARNATLAANLGSGLVSSEAQFGGKPDEKGRANPVVQKNIDLLKTLTDAAIKGTALTNDQLISIAENNLKLTGTFDTLKAAGESALGQGIIQFLKDAGVEQETLDQLTQKYNVTLAQTIAINDELVANLDTAKKSAREAFAGRSLQLTIAENSGDFEKNAKGLAVLRDQNQQAYDSTLLLIDSVGKLSDPTFVDFNNQLSKVIGLQGLFISQTELASIPPEELAQRQSELAGKLIEAAIAAGVNAEGLKKVTAEALKLTAAIYTIPTYKQVIVQIKTLYSEGGRTGRGGKDVISQRKLGDALKEQQKATKTGKDPTNQIKKIINEINKVISGGTGSNLGQLSKSAGGTGGKGGAAYNKPGILDIPEEIIRASNTKELIKQAVANARKLQSSIPGETKQNKGEVVELLNGTKRVLETRGIGEEYLRRAMDELTGEIKRQNDLLSKADTIRRIRVGTGDFSALANVPINSKSGVSVGGPQGPISISLNISGQLLTPAQFSLFADQIASSLKRQLSA